MPPEGGGRLKHHVLPSNGTGDAAIRHQRRHLLHALVVLQAAARGGAATGWGMQQRSRKVPPIHNTLACGQLEFQQHQAPQQQQGCWALKSGSCSAASITINTGRRHSRGPTHN